MDTQKTDLEIPDTDMKGGQKFVYWKAPKDLQIGKGFKIETPSKIVSVYATTNVQKDDYFWFTVLLEEKKENPELIKGR